MGVSVVVQDTPNPNAKRFLVDRPVQDSSRGRFFRDPDGADPLASALLAVAGVDGVMLLPASITVNKQDGASWQELERAVRSVLERYFD